MTVVLKRQNDPALFKECYAATGTELHQLADYSGFGVGWIVGPVPSMTWVPRTSQDLLQDGTYLFRPSPGSDKPTSTSPNLWK